MAYDAWHTQGKWLSILSRCLKPGKLGMYLCLSKSKMRKISLRFLYLRSFEIVVLSVNSVPNEEAKVPPWYKSCLRHENILHCRSFYLSELSLKQAISRGKLENVKCSLVANKVSRSRTHREDNFLLQLFLPFVPWTS